MRFKLKEEELKFEGIFNHIINKKMNKEKFPVENQVKVLINNMTGGENKKIQELNNRLNLDSKTTGAEILLALMEEREKNV